MFTSVHNYFSKKQYCHYDFINGLIIGFAVVTQTCTPLLFVLVILGISFIPSKER